MVNNITSFSSGNGMRDWLVQRVSALIMAVYAIVFIAALFSVDHLDYQFWHTTFQRTSVRVLTLLVVFSLLCHAWIGMWTVYTDYIKCSAIRLFLQVFTVISLITLFIWSATILWG